MGGASVMTPNSGGGFVRRSAPEPNKRALYVGGLDARITEEVLRQIFETVGHVQNVKIIPDKNVGHSIYSPASVHLEHTKDPSVSVKGTRV
jgi:RNA recognition motif-containing protein